MRRTSVTTHISRIQRRALPATRSSGRISAAVAPALDSARRRNPVGDASRTAGARVLEIASYTWAAQRCDTHSRNSRMSYFLFNLKACVQRGSWNILVHLRWWERNTRVVAVNLHYERASGSPLSSHLASQDRLLAPPHVNHARVEMHCVSNASLLLSSSASRLFLQRCAYAAHATPSARQGCKHAMMWGTDAVWYVRQIEQRVMTREDVVILLSGDGAHECRNRQGLVVGCIFSQEAMSWGERHSPSALLQMLPVKDRAAIVSFCFASGIPCVHPSQSQGKEGSLHSLLGLVLSHDAATWEDAFVVLQGLEAKLGLRYTPSGHALQSSDAAADLTHCCRFGGYIISNSVNHNLIDPAWVVALTRRILRDCNDESLLTRSMTFAELLLSSDEVVALCRDCGFTREAAIYAALATRARRSHTSTPSRIPWHISEDYRVVLQDETDSVAGTSSPSRTLVRRTLLLDAVNRVNAFASSLCAVCAEEDIVANESVAESLDAEVVQRIRSECNEVCANLHSSHMPPTLESASREMGVSAVLSIARATKSCNRALALHSLLLQCAFDMLTWKPALSRDGDGSVPQLYPSMVTLRDAAWRVHRDHGFPSEQTALVLLSATHAWDDVPQAVGAISRAGIDPAMRALHTMQLAHPQDTYYVSVALNPVPESAETVPQQQQQQRLLFEARPATVWNGETGGAAQWRGSSTGNEPAALVPSSSPQVSRGLWSKCLALLAQHPISVLERSPALHRLLGGVSESYVAAVASSVPQLTPPIISSWLEEYSRNGRWEAATLVLRAAHDHHVTPFMEPVVTLLERHNDDNEEVLRRLVSAVSVSCPKSAAYVFRAYAERAALAEVEEESMSWASALRILSASAVLGIGHYPAACLQCIAQHAPSTAVRTALQIISQPPAGAPESNYSIQSGASVPQQRHAPSGPTPAPMEVHALQRLVTACVRLQLNPEVDVYVVSPSRKRVAWWSSEARSVGIPAVNRLLSTQQVGLWNVALSEVACAAYWHTHSLKGHEGSTAARLNSSSSIHNAVRLAAFGSRDPHVVLTAMKNAERFDEVRLRRQCQDKQSAAMRFHMNGATRACVAGVLASRGDWVMALSTVPVSTVATPQPKVVQRARLHALTLSSRLRHQAHLVLRAQEGADVRRSHRRAVVHRYRIKRRASRKAAPARNHSRAPPGVRRLIKAHEMQSAFPWWKNWDH